MKWAIAGLAFLLLVPVVIVTAVVMPAASAAALCTVEPSGVIDPGPQGDADNARYVWRALLADGFSEPAAAGVLGNLQQESGLDPRLEQSDGPGVGIAQWSRGERWDGTDGLVPWAQRAGRDPWALQTQVMWLLKEMHAGWGGFDLDRYRSMTNVVAATVYFHDTYERSADSAQFVRVTRGGYAQAWYTSLQGSEQASVGSAGPVFVAGDSLTVGAKPGIEAGFADRGIPVTVAARNGITTQQGARLLDRPEARRARAWVVALGTNDDDPRTFRAGVLAVLRAAGDRPVSWLNIAGVPAAARLNAVLTDEAATHPQLHIVDYATQFAAHPGDVAGGFHLTPHGYAWRAQLYLAAAGSISAAPSFTDPACDPGSNGSTTCPKAPASVLSDQLRSHMRPNAIAVADCVAAGWPELRTIGGWRPTDPYPDHPSGQAVDIMLPQGCTQSAGKLALGNAIATFLMKNADAYRIQYLIWQQRIWTIREGAKPLNQWRTMADRGSCTANHMDHVHVSTWEPTPNPTNGLGGPDLGGFTSGPPGARNVDYTFKTPDAATRPCPPRLTCATTLGGAWQEPTKSGDYRSERRNPGNDPGNTRGAPNDHYRCHAGWDLAAPMGQPVVAAAAGQAHTGYQASGAGNYVTIDHGGGTQSLYMHLSAFAPAAHGPVRAGQLIGYVGSTGHSTGPHLHFEVRVNGDPYDPRHWLFGDPLTKAC